MQYDDTVKRNGSGGGSWSSSASVSGTSYTLTNADSGKNYIVRVRASNAQGTSGWTNSLVVWYVDDSAGSAGGAGSG